MEARFFRFAVVVALLTVLGLIGLGASSAWEHSTRKNDGFVAKDRKERLEVICSRTDIPVADKKSACDYLPTATAQYIQATSNVDNYAPNYAVLSFWMVVFPTGVMASYYALRWIITGRLRPLAPR